MTKLAEIFQLSEAPPGNPAGGTGPSRDPDVPDNMRGPGKDPAAPQAKPKPAKPADRPGISVSGDPESLEALMSALDSVRTRDPNLKDWADDAAMSLRMPVKNGQFTAQLPRFEGSLDLDDEEEDLY